MEKDIKSNVKRLKEDNVDTGRCFLKAYIIFSFPAFYKFLLHEADEKFTAQAFLKLQFINTSQAMNMSISNFYCKTTSLEL